jgi:hypothetical protein
MYFIRTKNFSKLDQAMRWALPDRVFFAAGACHILAHAFLERYGTPDMIVEWIKPIAGHTGNHHFISWGGVAFDYHGYTCRDRLLAHYWKRGRTRWLDWDATMEVLPRDVLTSEAKSRAYDGLWLREPGQFLHDATPRARVFLDRFGRPPSAMIP